MTRRYGSESEKNSAKADRASNHTGQNRSGNRRTRRHNRPGRSDYIPPKSDK